MHSTELARKVIAKEEQQYLEKLIATNGTSRQMFILQNANLSTSVTAYALNDLSTFSNDASNLIRWHE